MTTSFLAIMHFVKSHFCEDLRVSCTPPTWTRFDLSDEDEVKEWKRYYPWIAPELLEDKVDPSVSTDSYSFGLVCRSVYQKTKCKDQNLKYIWECLLSSANRHTLQEVMHLF